MIKAHFKKVISVLVIASILIGAFPASSFASGLTSGSITKGTNIKTEPASGMDVKSFIDTMNNEMAEIYGIKPGELEFPESIASGKLKAKIYKVSGSVDGKWTDLGYMFAYGEPFKYTEKDVAVVDGKKVYRYIGKAGYQYEDPGYDYTNIAFPYDDYGGWTFPDLLPGAKYNSPMIEEPWRKPRDIKKTLNKAADSVFYDQNQVAKQKIIEQIKLGIKIVHPELVGKTQADREKFEQIPWEKYVHIYQPPTYTAWGMGCIWHKDKSDGQIWYKTIPIAPYKLVESKYGIITLGFLDDDKVGTIDILESVDSKNQERLLKTISEDVVAQLSSFWEQFYRYMVSNYGKDPYNASDEEFDNAFDEFYNSYTEKEALVTAYDLFNQIFGGTIVDDLVFKYGMML